MTKKELDKLVRGIRAAGLSDGKTCSIFNLIGESMAVDNLRFDWVKWEKATGAANCARVFRHHIEPRGK